MSNKKMLISILIIIVFIIIIPKNEFAEDKNQTQAQQGMILGDVNSDKIVNTNDLILVLRHNYATSTGKHKEWILQGDKFKAADVTQNGTVDSSDTITISRYIASSNSPEIDKKHPEWKEMKTSKEIIEITNIALDKNSLDLEEGKTSKLTATISPSNATDKQLTWKTSNSKVATVDKDGNVTAIKVGKAIITVRSSNGKEAKCNVEVKSKAKSTTSTSDTSAIKVLKIDAPSTNKMTVGQEYKFKAIVDPKKASSSLKWSIGNSNIASITEQYLDTNNNATVKIKAKKKGTTTLEVAAPDGKTAKCSIVVEEKQTSSSSSSSGSSGSSSSSKSSSSSSSSKSSSSSSSSKSSSSSSSSKSSSSSSSSKSSSSSSSSDKTVSANKISVSPSRLVLVADETKQLKVTTEPANANVEIEWSSNNNSLVTVNDKGVITAKTLYNGKDQETATITAKDKNSVIQANCIVSVRNITIDNTSVTTQVGGTGKIGLRVKKGATVSVTSSKPDIVSVVKNNNEFQYKAIGVGTATITAKTTIGNHEYSAVSRITVVKPRSGGGSSGGGSSTDSSGYSIKINNGAEYVDYQSDSTFTLKATVTPKNAKITWTSSNTSVAFVDGTGQVTTHFTGSAIITAAIKVDGKVKAQDTIKVNVLKRRR